MPELRLVTFDCPETGKRYQFLTNIRHLAAGTIAAIYKDRWQVELFFKALKQTLKIKTFVGTSANAVRTQVWTALIAMLVLKYLQLKSTFSWSLSTLAALLRRDPRPEPRTHDHGRGGRRCGGRVGRPCVPAAATRHR